MGKGKEDKDKEFIGIAYTQVCICVTEAVKSATPTCGNER